MGKGKGTAHNGQILCLAALIFKIKQLFSHFHKPYPVFSQKTHLDLFNETTQMVVVMQKPTATNQDLSLLWSEQYFCPVDDGTPTSSLYHFSQSTLCEAGHLLPSDFTTSFIFSNNYAWAGPTQMIHSIYIQSGRSSHYTWLLVNKAFVQSEYKVCAQI